MDYTRLRPHWRPTHDANAIGFDRWLEPDGKNAWAKILNPDGHLCRQVWSVAPQARICLRLHPLSEQQDEMLRDPYGLGLAHASFWHNWLNEQGVVRVRVACEGINEAPIWNPGVVQAHNIYADSYAREMSRLGLTAVIGNFNTGWPGNTGPDTPVDWIPLTPTLHAIRQYGHYLGQHEYWDARGIDADWGWNPGRFIQLPQEFRKLPILITECGYDRAVNAPSGTGNHGWAGELSMDAYLEQLTEYDRHIRTQANLEAAFIFTHDFDAPWGTWDTRPLLDRLCGHAEWVRNTQPTAPGGHVTYLPNLSNGPQAPTNIPPEPQPPPPDDNWQRSIAFVMAQEGGYQDDPLDTGNWTGGAQGVGELKGTNFGISAASYPALDIVNLTEAEAVAIYQRDYWRLSGAADLPWPLSLLIFDTSVLHGVGTAQAWLAAVGPNPYAFVAKRLRVYVNSQHWPHFGAGWVNRTIALLQTISG